jgi:hypothetical protein
MKRLKKKRRRMAKEGRRSDLLLIFHVEMGIFWSMFSDVVIN